MTIEMLCVYDVAYRRCGICDVRVRGRTQGFAPTMGACKRRCIAVRAVDRGWGFDLRLGRSLVMALRQHQFPPLGQGFRPRVSGPLIGPCHAVVQL